MTLTRTDPTETDLGVAEVFDAAGTLLTHIENLSGEPLVAQIQPAASGRFHLLLTKAPPAYFGGLGTGGYSIRLVALPIDDQPDAPALGTLLLPAPNSAPVAASGQASTAEDNVLNGSLPAASDADGDPISYAAAGAPAHGGLVVNANGSYRYVSRNVSCNVGATALSHHLKDRHRTNLGSDARGHLGYQCNLAHRTGCKTGGACRFLPLGQSAIHRGSTERQLQRPSRKA